MEAVNRQADCLTIEQELHKLGFGKWTAKFLSFSFNYVALSPDHNQKAGTGVAFFGATPKAVIENVSSRLIGLTDDLPSQEDGQPVLATPPTSQESLPRDPTEESSESLNPIRNREMARTAGFEGDPCLTCGALMLVRNGTCTKCVACGSQTGCG